MNITIAIANILVAFLGLYLSLKQRRLAAVIWFLVSYFMLCFVPVANTNELVHIQQYTNGMLKIDNASIRYTLLFVLAFNCIFFIFDQLFYKLHRSSIYNPLNFEWVGNTNVIQGIFIACLAYGSVFYFLSTRDFNYNDYVENVASWPMVFLWCAGSGVCLAALRKNYFLAAIMTLPFLYFMLHLKIRSFALLSAIPFILTLFLQFSATSKNIFLSWRSYAVALPIFIVLLFGATYAMNTKQEKQRDTSLLPDAGMPFGCTIIMEGIRREQRSTGFNALLLYGAGITNPFRRLFGLPTPDITDPPVILAQIYEGFGDKEKTRFHYPVLWYTDAFLAFGIFGLFLAIFWAAVLGFFERLTTYNAATFCILLPAYCWHAYMLVRGAISGASVPFLYSVYISAIVFILFDYKSLFEKIASRASQPQQLTSSKNNPLFVVAK